MAPLFGGKKFELLFRHAAGLDMDKSDMKRLYEVVNQKMHDLLVQGVATAKTNDRDIVQIFDLPISKGLQDCINEVRKYETELELEPILKQLATLPRLDLDYSKKIESSLPDLVGGITVALAKTFKVINPELKNPQSQDWERVINIINILL